MLALIKTDLKNLFDIAPLIDADIIEKYNALYKAETGVSKPPITNGLTHIVITSSDDEDGNGNGNGNPYETKKIKDKIKIAQEMGIAYDPDIDALGDSDKEDPAVIMRVKPLGEEHFTDIRIDVVDVVESPTGGVIC
jgi:phosphomannomutase